MNAVNQDCDVIAFGDERGPLRGEHVPVEGREHLGAQAEALRRLGPEPGQNTRRDCGGIAFSEDLTI